MLTFSFLVLEICLLPHTPLSSLVQKFINFIYLLQEPALGLLILSIFLFSVSLISTLCCLFLLSLGLICPYLFVSSLLQIIVLQIFLALHWLHATDFDVIPFFLQNIFIMVNTHNTNFSILTSYYSVISNTFLILCYCYHYPSP